MPQMTVSTQPPPSSIGTLNPTPLSTTGTASSSESFTPHIDPNRKPLAELDKREAAVHVTIWNREECRKIAGNAAPLRRNLARYLKRHPECEEYTGQDKHPNYTNTSGGIDPLTGLPRSPQNEHVPIWNRAEKRKVTGNAAPLRKNLTTYLAKHPEYEVYDGQDKQDKPTIQKTPKQRQKQKIKAKCQNSSENDEMSDANTDGNTDDTGNTSKGSPSQWSSSSASNSDSASKLSTNANAARQKVNNTNVPFQSIKVLDSSPKHISWGSSAMLGTAVSSGSATLTDPQHDRLGTNHLNITLPALDNPNQLSYKEIASSWSNNPEWVVGPRSPGVIMNTSPPVGFNGLGAEEIKVSGIPIPFSAGARSRTRGVDKGGTDGADAVGNGIAAGASHIGIGRNTDVSMGGMSIGTSLGTPNGAAGIFIGSAGDLLDLSTSRPMDMDMGDGNIPQFSPSNFLRSVGSLKASVDAQGVGNNDEDGEDVDDDEDDDHSDDDEDDDEIMADADCGNLLVHDPGERSSPMQVPSRQPRIPPPIVFRQNR